MHDRNKWKLTHLKPCLFFVYLHVKFQPVLPLSNVSSIQLGQKIGETGWNVTQRYTKKRQDFRWVVPIFFCVMLSKFGLIYVHELAWPTCTCNKSIKSTANVTYWTGNVVLDWLTSHYSMCNTPCSSIWWAEKSATSDWCPLVWSLLPPFILRWILSFFGFPVFVYVFVS